MRLTVAPRATAMATTSHGCPSAHFLRYLAFPFTQTNALPLAKGVWRALTTFNSQTVCESCRCTAFHGMPGNGLLPRGPGSTKLPRQDLNTISQTLRRHSVFTNCARPTDFTPNVVA